MPWHIVMRERMGMDKQVYEIISENDLYEITGIQKQKFNTIYQLMALKQQNPESWIGHKVCL